MLFSYINQVQEIDVRIIAIGLPIIISIVGTVVSIMSVSQSKKQFEAENMDKLATKDYVKDKVDSAKNLCLEKIKAVEDENGSIKEDVKYIRSRIDRLIDLHLKEKTA